MSKKVIRFINKRLGSIKPVSQAAAPNTDRKEERQFLSRFAQDEEQRRRILGRSSGQGGKKQRSIMGEPVETEKKTLLGQ